MNTLYILCGLPFAGKTVISNLITQNKNFIHIDLDAIKFDYGYKDVDDDNVPDEEWRKIFSEFHKRIQEELKNGKNVLADCSNLTKSSRDIIRNDAALCGKQTQVIYLKIPIEVVRARLVDNRKNKTRFDVSDKIFDEAVSSFEEPTSDENVLVYAQEQPPEEWVKDVFLKNL